MPGGSEQMPDVGLSAACGSVCFPKKPFLGCRSWRGVRFGRAAGSDSPLRIQFADFSKGIGSVPVVFLRHTKQIYHSLNSNEAEFLNIQKLVPRYS
jgi:hypothetical protein